MAGNVKNPFEDTLNKDIGKLDTKLSGYEDRINKARTTEGNQKSKLIKDTNQKYQDLSKQYKTNLGDIKTQSESNIQNRRNESNAIVDLQKQNAGRESLIQSENGARAGKLSTNAISKLNSDISARFNDQLANSQKDNLSFQTQMDNKLQNLGFTVQDKNRIIDNFTKGMDQQAVAPLLASITAKANNKAEFTRLLRGVVTDLSKQTLGQDNKNFNKQKNIVDTTDAFTKMDPVTKRNFAASKIGSLINIDPSKINKLVNDVTSGKIDYGNFLQQAYYLKDRDKSLEQQKQTITGSQISGGIDTTIGGKTFIEGLKNKLYNDKGKVNLSGDFSASSNKAKSNSNYNPYTNTVYPSNTNVGSSTNKKITSLTPSQVLTVRSRLNNLKNTNPNQYKRAVSQLRNSISNGSIQRA